MDRKDPIPDATISRSVTRRLASSGLRAPCRIQVQTRRGEVTLSGTVQHPYQRDAALQAIRTVEGVRRVKDELKVKPPPRPQYKELPRLEPVPEAAAEEAPVEEAAAEEAAVEDTITKEASVEEAAAEEAIAEEAPVETDSTPDDRASHGDPQPYTNSTEAKGSPMGIRQTRVGDSYTFECDSREEADRLGALLADYPEWFKKNSWLGKPKQSGEVYRVTFHAKSVIEFLRQEGF